MDNKKIKSAVNNTLGINKAKQPKNRNKKLIIIALVAMLFAVTGALAFNALTKEEDPFIFNERECPPGTYSSWSGGAPTGNPEFDYNCLSKEEYDITNKRRNTPDEKGDLPSLKPVIMLYSEKNVEFKINQRFMVGNSFIYPQYNLGGTGWRGTVLAGSEGKIIINSKDYDYIFWEGITKEDYDLSVGNIVARTDTVQFLENALEKFGLNSREKQDFITFWGPKLQKNEYNLISFVNDQYVEAHPMSIEPEPDYIQRIFMVIKKADRDQKILKQEFTKAEERTGFSLIEWGGLEAK